MSTLESIPVFIPILKRKQFPPESTHYPTLSDLGVVPIEDSPAAPVTSDHGLGVSSASC